jgi:hypothetical protein
MLGARYKWILNPAARTADGFIAMETSKYIMYDQLPACEQQRGSDSHHQGVMLIL